jgi:glycine oxidase
MGQPAKTIDYIIVGQGLAGSCLALQLLLKNKSIMVLDQPKRNRASLVAAGLFNPVTGRVMAKTWMADTLFPYLVKFYLEAERFLHQKFFYPHSLYRPFISVQEQNGWMSKSADPSFGQYMDGIFTGPTMNQVRDPFGGMLLKRSGYLDVPAFVKSITRCLEHTNAYLEEELEEQKLIVAEDHVQYGHLKAGKIIFCGGIESKKSHFFSWLPINPLKGETIQVRMASMDHIYNRGVYVVPASTENEYTVGATYDFQSQSPEITATARIELESKLNELMRLRYTFINQNWGIRATSIDQKLIIGAHPRWRNLIIFNGLGTKGVSLAPYFSEQLAAWLEGTGEILPVVNIDRFKALYSKLE